MQRPNAPYELRMSHIPTLLVIDKGGIARAVEMRVVGQSELESWVKEAQGN